jgi:anti-sigma-K factor RskA
VQSRPLRAYQRLLAICLIALFLSTGSTYFFYRKWSEAEDWYRAERISKDTLSAKITELQIAFDRTFNDLAVMHNENNSIAFLQAADSTKRYFARVYWNRYTHETFLDVQNVPPAPDGKVYQLWAIDSAKAINAGVVQLRDDRILIPMRNIKRAETWAITVEPIGGSVIPDSTMFLVVKLAVTLDSTATIKKRAKKS